LLCDVEPIADNTEQPTHAMPTDLDMLDFERDFLADVLRMLGERLWHLHRHVDWEHPEESYVFDPMEHLAGVGVVAVQRYLASICSWFAVVDRTQALQLGPQRKGVAIAAVMNAAANYWKHIEDDRPIQPRTRRVLEQIGVTLDSSYCVSNTLYECGYPQFTGLLGDLVSWRNAVSEYVRAKA
jgi:hypothetical protein